MHPDKMYINGRWIDAINKIDVINPATKKIIGSVPNGGATEAKMAVEAAYPAFQKWSKQPAEERGKLLMKWFDLIEKHKDELAEIMTLEQGKPLQEARGEITYANSFISWYAEEGKRIYGETIPASSPDKRIFVQKQPVGVIAAITPWNFPAAMITRKVAPALAAGCTVVLKPSEETPFTALKLAELADQAGIPNGVLNVVTGDAESIANAWQKDSRVRKLTFTGSTPVGKILMRGAADTVKKISLELGGHAPLIVTAQADIDKAVDGAIASKFRNAGQTCICTNRILADESIAEEFTVKLAEKAAKLKVGNGLEESTDIGPLINEEAVKKVIKHIEDAKQKGGRVLTGGNRLTNQKGYFIEPTVIANAKDDMLCMVEETFGPLIPVATFKTIDEAIERANNSSYGLAAYVYTENLREAVYISEALEYGIVGVNDGAPSAAQAPFGGFKESGLGREGSRYGIEEFLEIKYISLGL
ncbi:MULTISPECIES: NAD-dependent succinate-semialdehyde dehydrogenase [Thermoactinomyces]|jgi:succinate-semialdehyde dehydrogenase / glutarate-semialdehyde dehydrogenase|uniref:Aldehyde dehydrogenase n=1 Tax=Thermoactinomyces daqus TaxID=1329516 RepID=A0A7W1XBS7_9BACL|nr:MULTISPECIES: NAD-dependent succinate-semialdehyde dehydrogenase [Thermoactinomyces]MBA4543752.1 NAD-dependent succinate-semialdehyde dehydrogenase [Thermoactinomyces daqus]MBH8598375.1 NAD-dependent succinate-semialdehyde dehydrogenase [Thermoactinomyces sp. CICC 10523]MBH8607497.1 NAD-dependent succinate-semialdehyde dehydrogenase [Thermoactinomyces sp. CICC 10521]